MPIISYHELQRRHAGLMDMRRYLARQEQDFATQRAEVHAFAERYQALFGPLFKELGTLDSQLRTTTNELINTLRLRGIELRLPDATPAPQQANALQAQMPQLAQMARFAGLPPDEAPPPVPQGADIGQWAPPTLKMLYRRAAMRLHPDRAANDTERGEREQQMMAVNAAFAAHDRQALEAILLKAGEDAGKITGGNIQALCNWLAHCEERVQARLRLVNSYMSALANQSMCKLWQSVSLAESRGIDPLNLMAIRLHEQIVERRKELYIAQRVKPESSLARAFLHQRAARGGTGLAT